MSPTPDIPTSLFADVPDPAQLSNDAAPGAGNATPTARDRAPLLNHPAPPASAAGALPMPLLAANVPTRATVRRERALALAVSLAWLCGHLAVYGVRGDLQALPWAYRLVQIVLPLALALASLVISLWPGRHGLGLRVELLSLLALLGPTVYGLIAIGAPQPGTPPEHTWLDTLVCFDITLSWAAIPLACAAVSMRHAYTSASLVRSALLGGSCGLVAGGIMNLHCENSGSLHMLAGHAIPVAIAAVVGALFVRRLTRA